MKKFIKVPEGKLERILFAAELASSLSGQAVSLDEVLHTIEEENIDLTKEIKNSVTVEINEINNFYRKENNN